MGSDSVLQFLTSPVPLSSPLTRRYPLNTCNPRCFSTSSGGSRGGARWESRRSPKDYYQRVSWDEDKEVEYGYGKQRIWWSDDTDYEDDDEDGFDGFGVLESSIGFSWAMKVLRAFGWMIPAIIMSAVLGTGTGTNTIIMAVALPLAQSAFSLVMDAIWGWSDEGPRSKSKKKERPYTRAANDPGRRAGKERKNQNGKEVGGSQSWANGAPDRKKAPSTQSFGGWDELDNLGMEGQLKKPATWRPNEPREWTNGKLSKRIGKTETPLLLRLLIAVFPFLGSWTKLL